MNCEKLFAPMMPLPPSKPGKSVNGGWILLLGNGMKLNNLRGAIRKTKGNPFFVLEVTGGTLKLNLMKMPLLEELEATYGAAGATAETGWSFDESTGEMKREWLAVPIVKSPEQQVHEAKMNLAPHEEEYYLDDVAPAASDTLLDL